MGSVRLNGLNNQHPGDIVASNASTGIVANCYCDVNASVSGKLFATTQTLGNMSSTTFYTVSLGWDSEIWDFANVSLADGIYPKLKQR